MTSINIDQEMGQYVSQLEPESKLEVLRIVRDIAKGEHEDESPWDDPEFVKEMERRSTEYKNGTAKLLTWGEITENTRARCAQKKSVAE